MTPDFAELHVPDSRLSILAVTSELPWPLTSGGRLRSYHLLKRLARDHDVRLVAPAAGPEALGALEDAGVSPRPVPGVSRHIAGQAARALASIVRRQPYVMYRRHDHGPVRRALRRELAAAPTDVLYLDHLDSFCYVDEAHGRAVVGDLHNVYSLLIARTAADESRRIVRRYLAHEARLLATAETAAARTAALLMTVSATEREYFARLGPAAVAVVPNGVDCARYAHLPAGRRTGPPTVMFLGAMSWEPNVAAAEFLARDVLPALLPRVPDVRLRIVGRDPTPRVQRLAGDRVEVTGSVPDVLAPLADAHVLAVPLLAGGGTRLKILEAFAAGLPVVSTPVGCEGIAADPDRHLVVAETPAFAEALARTLLAPEAAATMAAAARVLARDRYDWDAIGAGASAAIRQAVMAATGLRTTTAGR